MTSGTTAAPAAGQRSVDPDRLRLLDAWWRAANYLSVGQIYLRDNPLLRRPLEIEPDQAAAARALGHHAGPDLPLGAPQPGDRRPRPRRALRHRPRARRAGRRRRRVPGGHVQRALLDGHRGRGGDAGAVPAVLLPRRHPEPRRAGDTRLDQRGRRARLLADARVRGRVRQPGPAGRLRDRGRRGRDRAAVGVLALEQVPRPGRRRRGAADPAPQRLQDRQPDRAGPDPRAGAARPDAWVRLPAVRAGGGARRRPPRRACADGVHNGRDPRPHRRDQAGRPAAGTPTVHSGRCWCSVRRRAGPGRARWTASRSRGRSGRTRCRCPACARTPSTWPSWSAGCGRTGRRSCSTTPAGCGRRSGRPRRPDSGG